MLSKLKIKSSNRFSYSYNLGRYINKKNLVIFNKKKLKERKYLIKDIKRENYNNKNVLNLISINNNNSIYNKKSDKGKFLKKYNLKHQNKNIENILGKNKHNIIKNNIFRNINDMQDMDYEEAILFDKRRYIKIYWGFLVDTQIILSTFCSNNHLDLFAIKLGFFVFTFQISFFLNALHKKI